MDKSKLTFVVPERNPDQDIKELILYIAKQCANDPTFGDVKLNKILQFADFASFAEFGEPITGAEYIKEKRGIILKRMLPIRQQMLQDDDIELSHQPVYQLTRTVVIAKRDADLTRINMRSLEVVDRFIKLFWDKSSDEISRLSQQQMGYKVAEVGESIPYEASLLSNEEITEADKKRTEELAREHGWEV